MVEATVNGIARDHGLGSGATQGVLSRFVQAELLIKESRGRVVWYRFNSKNPLVKPRREMIRLAYESIPEPQRKEMFEPTYVPGS